MRYPLGRAPRSRGAGAPPATDTRSSWTAAPAGCTRRAPPATARVAGPPAPVRSDVEEQRLRPDGWTSADAAGLPIMPGLLRLSEVKARDVDHAIRFTTDVTPRHHMWPARHDAGRNAAASIRPWVPGSGWARFPATGFARHQGGHARDQDLRTRAGRQRLAVVLPGRAEPSLAEQDDLGTQEDSRWAFVAVDTSGLEVYERQRRDALAPAHVDAADPRPTAPTPGECGSALERGVQGDIDAGERLADRTLTFASPRPRRSRRRRDPRPHRGR